jgi:hypothetical protein
MPTGPKHYRIHEVLERGKLVEYGEECRCMMGEDHGEDGESLSESLSVWDAADIWLSNGMDEDYTFGYSEDELRRAADMD